MSDRPPDKAIVPPEKAGQAVWPVWRPTAAAGEAGRPDDAGAGPKAIRPPAPSSPPNPSSSVASGEQSPGGLIADALDVTADVLDAVGGVLSRRLTGPPSDAPATNDAMEPDPDARRLRQREAGIVLDCGETDTVQHVGVIFVHGIGSQAAGETLRDWGGSIIRVLSRFRIGEKKPADPVVTTQLDPSAGKTLYIEVELPAIKAADGSEIPAEHWVMTEAWWAQRIAPPPFAQMAQWLGPLGAVRRILEAMFAAQKQDDPRQRSASQAHLLERGPKDEKGLALTLESREAQPMLSKPVEVPTAADDTPQAPGSPAPPPAQPFPDAEVGTALRPGPIVGLFERIGVFTFIQAASALVLLLYGFLRSIEKLLPIGPLKNGALTRPIDNFLLNWFGDVHVLLGDPAQSASVRARLVDAIWDLEAIHCKPITIVAHSGGAIVTYMTLADPMTAELQVDRVVTHGEGANLAWRLTKNGDLTTSHAKYGVGPADVFGDLYRSITGRKHPVLWTDMWASQDPAPVGLMTFPRVGLPAVESIGVWNRMSFREDHGTYWSNDEEFVIPLLRRLVGSDNDAAGDRFGSDQEHVERSTRRRQRIAALSFWTQFCPPFRPSRSSMRSRFMRPWSPRPAASRRQSGT